MEINSSFVWGPMMAIPIVLGALSVLFFFVLSIRRSRRRISNRLPAVPSVDGALPLLGNLMQLKGTNPFLAFTRWADVYGPIYSIRIGPSTAIVLNSTELVKEAIVTRYDAVPSKDTTTGLRIVSLNKLTLSMSDYNDYYRMAKRHLVSYIVGSKAMKRSQHLREAMVEHIINQLTSSVEISPTNTVNIREMFESALFQSALKEGVGFDGESVYVEELSETLSRNDVYKVLVLDTLKAVAEIDIRDLFPYLRWLPFPSTVEKSVKKIVFRMMAVLKALVNEHKRLYDIGQGMSCYYDYLKSQPDTNELSESQILLFVWESIVGRTDTSSITVEWALFELAKDAQRQEKLHQEIQKLCGTRMLCEEHLDQIPYLSAIVQETLRTHHPSPILPPRLVKEDTQIGGYHIPAGTKIMINVFGCNKDKMQWKDADEWIPERFVPNKFDQQEWFKTVSFGAGKRVCLGATLGMLTTCLMVGRLVQKFELRLKDEDKGDIDTAGLTTHKLHPLRLRLKIRS